jgi:hypothetical protein
VSPDYQVVTDLSKYVQIIPVTKDNVSSLPPSVITVLTQLPLGAFLLINQKEKPIMTVTVDWKFVDNEGKEENRTYLCDGYLRLPAAPVVDSSATSLITPTGCTREELFPRLISGGLTSNPFESNKGFAAHADLTTGVFIIVDAVIFSDGEVAGPDKRQYTKEIVMRDRAMRSVASSVESAGTDRASVDNRLSSITSNAVGSHDKQAQMESQWASTLRHSPNLSGTIAAIKLAAPLPVFFHSN